MNETWYTRPVNELEAKWNTNAVLGLSRKAARSRLTGKEGSFYLFPRKSVGQCLRETVSDSVLILLLLTACISAVFDRTGLAITIFAVLLLNVAAVFASYLVSRRLMEAMPSYVKPHLRVVREGKLYDVDADGVVQGDVVLLRAGDLIPFDGRILSCERFSVFAYLGKDGQGKERYAVREKGTADEGLDPSDPLSYGGAVHAGSVVRSGEARVMVAEVGRYTYIGALEGGFAPMPPEKPIRVLEYVKDFNRQYSFWSLLAVLPVTMLAFLGGGHSMGLLESFLIALCLAVSSMGHFLNAFSHVIVATSLVRGALTSVSGHNAAILTSPDKLDTIAYADTLLLFGTCGLTDGVFRLHSVYADMTVHTDPKEASEVLEWGTLFFDTMLRAPQGTEGYSASFVNGYRSALRSHTVDVGKLAVRYPHRRFEPMGYGGRFPCVKAWGATVEKTVLLSDEDDLAAACTLYRSGGEIKTLDPLARERLRQTLAHYADEGCAALSLATVEGGRLCFEGMLAFTESYLPESERDMTLLRRAGVHTAVFMEEESRRSVGILKQSGMISSVDEVACASQFRREGRSLDDSAMSYRAYLGFSHTEIASLIDRMRASGRRIAALGLGTSQVGLLVRSHVAMTCDTAVYPPERGERPLTRAVDDGSDEGRRASPVVKGRAHALIRRGGREGGGLRGVVNLIETARTVYLNLLNLYGYLVTALILRALMAILPLLFGVRLLSPTQLLLAGMTFDGMAVAVCAFDKAADHGVFAISIRIRQDFSNLLGRRPAIVWAALGAGTVSWALPLVLYACGVWPSLETCRSYAFVSLILIQWTVLYLIRLNLYGQLTSISFNVIQIAAVALSVLVFLLSLVWPALATAVGVTALTPLSLWLLPIGPAVAVAVYAIVRKVKE